MDDNIIRKFKRLNESHEVLSNLHKCQRNALDSLDNARRKRDIEDIVRILKLYEQQFHSYQMDVLQIAYELILYIQEKEI